MKILVTGISGRIGANLAQGLLNAGHSVRGLVWSRDARPSKLASLPVELVEGTLVEPADVNRAVDGVDAVYHLGAAFQGGGPFSDTDYFEINVRGTFNMLEAARRNGDRLQHFFFASTDAIYDKYVPGGLSDPIQEDTMPAQPGSPYALSKVLGEDLCRGYMDIYGVPLTIFRFALAVAGDEILDFRQFRLRHWLDAYAGRTDETGQQVYAQLQSLAEGDSAGERLLLARDETGRTYKKHIADVRDIVGGMLAGMGNRDALGQTFQLAGPGPFTWEETVPYLADGLGVDSVEARLAGTNPTYYEFDMRKTREILGYTPQYDLRTMIDDALAFRRGETAGVIATAAQA